MSSASQPYPMYRHLAAGVYLLVVLAAGVFCYGRSLALFVTAVAAALLAWLVVESGPKRPAPRVLLNIILLAALYYLVQEIYTTFLTQSVVIALARFVVAILLCKLFEPKRFRDIRQIVGLSLVVTVSGMMVAPSGIGFFAVCMTFFVVLAYVAMLMAVCRDGGRGGSAGLLTPLTPGVCRRFAGDLRRALKPALAVMVPVALGIFFLLPRSRTAAFSTDWNSPTQTGLNELGDPTLRDVEDLTPSDEIVMQVTLKCDGMNIGSEFYQPYFRWRAIEDNPRGQKQNGGTTQEGDFTGADFKLMKRPHLESGYILEDYTIYNPPQNVLFAVGTPATVISDQFIGVAYNEDLGTLHHFGGAKPLRYSLICPTRVASDAFARPPQPPSMPTRSKNVNEGVVNLAHQIVPDLPKDGTVPPERTHEVASAFETYLKTHYRYSLSTHESPEGIRDSLDPATDFLLHRQQIGGYCQYFAAGMVLLCRCAGIQAREVTGYYGGEFNSVGGYYIVRQKDAHEWVEYYVPGEGWVRGDPTASSPIPSSTSTFLFRTFHDIRQAVEDFWLSTVVTFDNDSRRRAFAWIYSVPSLIYNKLTTPEILWVLVNWSPVILALILAPLVLALVRRWHLAGRGGRRAAHRRHPPSGVMASERLSTELDFLRKLLEMLGRISPRRSDQTPREFVAAQPLDGAREDARWLVETAYAVLWGGRKVEPALQRQITLAMDRVAARALVLQSLNAAKSS